MTILTNIALQKADAVEIERRYSGGAVRRAAYCGYILIAAVSTVLLYLFPTALMISIFVAIHLSLLLSLYFLVQLVINSSENDLVYDGTRLAWRPSFSSEGENSENRRSSYIMNQHLSYTFI